MMPEQLETAEQVRRHLAQSLRMDREFMVLPCRYGWVCQVVLSDQELANGQGLGLGNYVVNRQTGVITIHSSLAPTTIGEQYDEAIQSGRPVPGRQVYPPTWQISIDRLRETPTEIEYRVQARSLTHPPAEPPIDRMLTINKHNHRFHTDTRATHETCMRAAGWARAQSQQNGVWPRTGTFQL